MKAIIGNTTQPSATTSSFTRATSASFTSATASARRNPHAEAASALSLVASAYGLWTSNDDAKQAVFSACMNVEGRDGQAVMETVKWWAKCETAVQAHDGEGVDFALGQLIATIRDRLGDPRAAVQVFNAYERFVRRGRRVHSDAQEECSRCFAVLRGGYFPVHVALSARGRDRRARRPSHSPAAAEPFPSTTNPPSPA